MIIFIAYLHRCGHPPPRPCSSSSSPSAAGPAAAENGLAFTDDEQGAAVAQAGLDIDAGIYADPPEHRQPPDRPLLHYNIMREHLGHTDGEHHHGSIFLEL